MKKFDKKIKPLQGLQRFFAYATVKLPRIRREILHMPDYFEGYETEVHFISQDELQEKHSKMPHGGTVIRVGKTGEEGDENESKAIYDFSLKLDSNPEFTGAVLTAYARAAYQLAAKGESGCRTIFDIPPSFLSASASVDLIKAFLRKRKNTHRQVAIFASICYNFPI